MAQQPQRLGPLGISAPHLGLAILISLGGFVAFLGHSAARRQFGHLDLQRLYLLPLAA